MEATHTAEARHQDNGANEVAWPLMCRITSFMMLRLLRLRLAFSEDSGMAIGVFNILHDAAML